LHLANMVDASITSILRDIATTAALLIAAAWGIWKWRYEEQLRRKREMASPDGTLTTTNVDMTDDKTIVSLHALWRNRGPLPIELCPEHTRVEVFEIENRRTPGRLELGNADGVNLINSCSVSWGTYVMEPNTDSIMQEHFVVDRTSTYGFRWIICLSPGSIPGALERSHVVCTRELIWRAEDSDSR